MSVIEGVSDGADDLERLVFRNPRWIPAAQQLGGVGSLDIVHRKPQLALDLAAVVDADNMWMPQLRGEVRFAAESLPVLLVRSQAGGQHLEGVSARQSRMLGLIDLAHPAGSQ